VDINLGDNAVLDTAELRSRGLSQRKIEELVRRGRLHRVERGIFTTAPPTGVLLLQALQVRRPQLVYTGRTALQLYCGETITLPVEGLVQKGRSRDGSAMLNLRIRRKIPYREHEGLLLSPPVGAVADCLGDVAEAELIDFLEQQYTGPRGRVLMEAELNALLRVPRALRSLISRAAIGADSEAEREVFRALRARGLTVVQNHGIGGYFFDGVLPDARLIVEIDGYRYHSAESRETFVADRWKANYATRHGYRVLRYSGSCVKYHLELVVEQIVAAARDLEEELFSEEHQVWEWHETLNRDGPWMREVAQ
jgi:very-short-patch-repair endonuclease